MDQKKPLLQRIYDDMEFEFKPCEFCGRMVLAGWCCQEALDKAKEANSPKQPSP